MESRATIASALCPECDNRPYRGFNADFADRAGANAVNWLADHWWAIPTLAAILLLAFRIGRQK